MGTDDLCKMQEAVSGSAAVSVPAAAERMRDAYVANLRERFYKDHIYVRQRRTGRERDGNGLRNSMPDDFWI